MYLFQVTLKIPSTSRSHSRCFVCKRPGPKLITLSAEGRVAAFIQHNLLINAGARCCPGHIADGCILQKAVEGIQTVRSQSVLSRSSINDLLQKMRGACIAQQSFLNFEKLNDSDYPSLTGITRTQFDDVCSHLVDKVKNTPSRSARTSIGLFLVKLYSGISNKLLSTIFGLTKSCVRRAVWTVRQAFMRGFVPLYLGVEAFTRDDILSQHTRPLARKLFGAEENQLILVLDGTYIYINKSNNFAFQRRTYSIHKNRPLVKPMVVVTTTGHFLTIVGPYMADGKNNDAAILNHMLKSNIDEFRSFLKEGDILVVDRGFRDSLSLLDDLGIQAEMPTFLKKGEKQMSTEDANASRLVTKVTLKLSQYIVLSISRCQGTAWWCTFHYHSCTDPIQSNRVCYYISCLQTVLTKDSLWHYVYQHSFFTLKAININLKCKKLCTHCLFWLDQGTDSRVGL